MKRRRAGQAEKLLENSKKEKAENDPRVICLVSGDWEICDDRRSFTKGLRGLHVYSFCRSFRQRARRRM